ncbi:MAG: flippase-like domain-containing protein [Prevotellaceae bacterium]|jgi:uncharacterized protein (TIRG00374 family)|nr:flippase-like domain-containing protein [Prevotellaceae bacterium]
MKIKSIKLHKLVKKSLEALLPLVVGTFVMVWVYRDFDFSSVKGVLLGMHWEWLLLSLVVAVFSHIIRGIRWQLTLHPLNAYPRTSVSINAVFISYAANLLLPRVGELSRCAVLSKYEGISFSKSLGTLVSERLVDGLCVLLITISALVVRIERFDSFFAMTGTDLHNFGAIFLSVRFYVILVAGIGLLVLLFFLARSLFFWDKIKEVAHNMWVGILSIRHTKHLTLYILETIAIWVCYFLQFYLPFYAFDFTAELGFWAAMVAFVAGSFAIIVPTPNGAGPWHYAVITVLVLYGVDGHDAATFALLVHAIQTLLVIVLGIYGLAALAMIHKNKTNTELL